MAGFSLGGVQTIASKQPKRDGQSMVNPTTGATQYWSTDRGDYVDRNTLAGLQSGALVADPAQNRIVANPTNYIQPSYAPSTRTTSTRTAGSNPDFNSAAMLSKIDQLWNKPAPTYNAPQQSEEIGTSPADMAFFGESKTRLGNTLRQGMNLLNDEMNMRGISPDSRLAFHELGNLTRGALGEFAETERDMLMNRQNRNRDIRDRNIDRTTGALRDNQAAQLSTQNRLQSLLSYYGMVY